MNTAQQHLLCRRSSGLAEDRLENVFYSQCQSGVYTSPQGATSDWISFADAGVSPDLARNLFQSMVMTRVAHNVSRREALKGKVYYTIGPGGNESVCAVAAAMRTTDPSILHYRDTSFQFMRSLMTGLSAEESMMQMMRTYTCSASDCNSGGRHKALGDPKLNLIPSTSTISSHYPRGIGIAASIPLVKRLNCSEQSFAPESICMMSGGDASINHATFQTSVNFARYTHLGRKMPLPALFLISDNGYGISVPTPDHWVEECLSNLGLPYETADGTQLPAVYAKALKMVSSARRGTPSFLHLKTARLFNHAGSDAGNYMNPKQHAWHAERDPISTTAFILQQEGIMNAKDIEDMYRHNNRLAEQCLSMAMSEPKLTSVESIMSPLVRDAAAEKEDSKSTIGPWAPIKTEKRVMILKQQINAVLAEVMEKDPAVVLFGEDVADKGGNYGVTDGLKKKFGPLRVRDTLLDETSILGLMLGFSLNGLVPIAEICYLAYIHNAIDQIRGEGATLSFFSNGQYKNGGIVRVAGGGLTEFGGHFHNENSLSPLLDMPGVVVMYPSNGPDYVRMFRTAVNLAKKEGRIVIVIEPIRLYATRQCGTSYPYPRPHPYHYLNPLTSDVTYVGRCVPSFLILTFAFDLVGQEEWAFSYPQENEVLRIGDFVAHEFGMQRGLVREGFIYRHGSCK